MNLRSSCPPVQSTTGSLSAPVGSSPPNSGARVSQCGTGLPDAAQIDCRDTHVPSGASAAGQRRSLFHLGGSVYAPFSLRAILRLRAWHVLIPLLVGTALAALSLEARSYPGLLVACAVIGLGQGPGYTLGLATVTHGRP
ncbi:MAG: major facilitator superfamily permease, partial [Arthrobacter sp.]|nr:major facilitator superfamily permease [Arthrobacter sp.]